MYGDHNVANATAAITVAFHLKIPLEDIKKGLENFNELREDLQRFILGMVLI